MRRTAILFLIIITISCTKIKTQTCIIEHNIGSINRCTVLSEDIKPYESGWYITGYCACAKCCGIYAQNRPNGVVYGSSGRVLIPGYSCAADLPSGTIVEILYPDGSVQERRVDDTGGGVHGKHLDLYEETHDKALQVGYNNVLVRIKEAP